ncbi:MAG: hypothetical protein R6V07_01725 [Armatimonadota bacterium]
MPTVPDERHISNGREIPGEGYADQPYIVQTDDGAWLRAMTTGHQRRDRLRRPREVPARGLQP